MKHSVRSLRQDDLAAVEGMLIIGFFAAGSLIRAARRFLRRRRRRTVYRRYYGTRVYPTQEAYVAARSRWRRRRALTRTEFQRALRAGCPRDTGQTRRSIRVLSKGSFRTGARYIVKMAPLGYLQNAYDGRNKGWYDRIARKYQRQAYYYVDG